MMRRMFHRRNLHTFLAILGILFCTRTVQADTRGSEIVTKLQKKFADLETLSAHFAKRHYWRVTDQHQEVNGKLLVQRPDQLRTDSDVQVVVSNGKTVWHYAPANAQVLVSDYTAMENDRNYEKLLFDLIFWGGYDENYVSVYVGEEKIHRKTCYAVDLLAKKEDTYIHKIRLWIDKRLYLVRQVEYRNIHEDVTTFVLSDLKVNKKARPDQFTFHVPSGVELIDLR